MWLRIARRQHRRSRQRPIRFGRCRRRLLRQRRRPRLLRPASSRSNAKAPAIGGLLSELHESPGSSKLSQGVERMSKRLSAVLFGVFLTWPSALFAQTECYPNCAYNHYYGPSDFTYLQPGLFGYPRCGPRGDCSPRLTYRYSWTGERILIQPRRRTPATQQ
jgi:hypothetical protein